jgi:hypothetical protein
VNFKNLYKRQAITNETNANTKKTEHIIDRLGVQYLIKDGEKTIIILSNYIYSDMVCFKQESSY